MGVDIKKLFEQILREKRAEKLAWQIVRKAERKILQLNRDCGAYNIEDTSGEPRPSSEEGGPDWDGFWHFYTREGYPPVCAACGKTINAASRNGSHVRLDTEPDGTKDAWIAILCDSCNNWQNREHLTLKKGSWLVRVKMVQNRNNAMPRVVKH